jgi:hypothetical protein
MNKIHLTLKSAQILIGTFFLRRKLTRKARGGLCVIFLALEMFRY